MSTPTHTESPTEPRRFSAPNGIRFEPTRRKIRTPWVLFGVLLVLGSALTFAVWGSSMGSGTAVLALSTDVQAGSTLEASDLTTVEVSADRHLAVVPADRADDFVGRVAASDLAAGTLVTEEVFVESPPLRAGESLVGIAVDPTAMPVPDLRAGDSVLVVETPSTAHVTAEDDAERAVSPMVWTATVFTVATIEDTAGFATTVVSVRIDSSSAPDVAAAAAADRVRLVLVGSLDDFPAHAPALDDLSAVPSEPADELGGSEGDASLAEGSS